MSTPRNVDFKGHHFDGDETKTEADVEFTFFNYKAFSKKEVDVEFFFKKKFTNIEVKFCKRFLDVKIIKFYCESNHNQKIFLFSRTTIDQIVEPIHKYEFNYGQDLLQIDNFSFLDKLIENEINKLKN